MKPKRSISDIKTEIDPDVLDRFRKQSEHLNEALAKVGQNVTMEELANISRCVAPMASFQTHALRASVRAQEEYHHDDIVRRFGYAVFPPEPIDTKRLREFVDTLPDLRSRRQKISDWLYGWFCDIRWWVKDHLGKTN